MANPVRIPLISNLGFKWRSATLPDQFTPRKGPHHPLNGGCVVPVPLWKYLVATRIRTTARWLYSSYPIQCTGKTNLTPFIVKYLQLFPISYVHILTSEYLTHTSLRDLTSNETKFKALIYKFYFLSLHRAF
jgi:hypothetical protein